MIALVDPNAVVTVIAFLLTLGAVSYLLCNGNDKNGKCSILFILIPVLGMVGCATTPKPNHPDVYDASGNVLIASQQAQWIADHGTAPNSPEIKILQQKLALAQKSMQGLQKTVNDAQKAAAKAVADVTTEKAEHQKTQVKLDETKKKLSEANWSWTWTVIKWMSIAAAGGFILGALKKWIWWIIKRLTGMPI